MMNHEMKLQPSPYEKIRSGSKTIELRLMDEKRQKIQIGDTITFTDSGNPDRKMIAEVTGLYPFPAFKALFETLPLEKCGMNPSGSIAEAVEQMRRYYPEEKEAMYGVLGIQLRFLREVQKR